MAGYNGWTPRRMNNYDSNQWNRPYSRTTGDNGWFGHGRQQYFKKNGGRKSHVKLIIKNDVSYLSGWKVGKTSGFRSFFVSPAKNPKTITSKSGKVWVTCKVSVVNKTHGTTGLAPAFWNTQTNKVICKQLGLILDPNTGFISYIPRKK